MAKDLYQVRLGAKTDFNDLLVANHYLITYDKKLIPKWIEQPYVKGLV
jgi:hypothetical protein